MANSLKMANAAVNAEADALSDLLDGGFVRIYDGAQPATADTALSGQTLLAEIPVATPASGAAVAGVLTFTVPISDTSANATGTAAWFRAVKSDGTTGVMDGSVGLDSGTFDLEIANTVSIVTGATVTVTAWTHTIPKA